MSSALETVFHLPLDVMDVVQLLVSFMAADDVRFTDHIFVFQLFKYSMFPHSIAFSIHVYTFAETLLLFFLLESFFSTSDFAFMNFLWLKSLKCT